MSPCCDGPTTEGTLVTTDGPPVTPSRPETALRLKLCSCCCSVCGFRQTPMVAMGSTEQITVLKVPGFTSSPSPAPGLFKLLARGGPSAEPWL